MDYCYQIRTSQFGRYLEGDTKAVEEVVNAVDIAAGWAKYVLVKDRQDLKKGEAALVGPGSYTENILHPGDVVVRVESNDIRVFPWDEFKKTFWRRRPQPVREDWEEGE